jgi:hypothetical protein
MVSPRPQSSDDEAASDEAASAKPNRELLAKREAVQVLVRVRPHLSTEDVSQSFVSVGEGSVSVSGTGGRCYSSKVHRAFSQDTSQIEVFEHVVPLLDSVLAGFNASVLAYGQTGSGTSVVTDFPAHTRSRTRSRACFVRVCVGTRVRVVRCRQDVYDERAAYSGAGRLSE